MHRRAEIHDFKHRCIRKPRRLDMRAIEAQQDTVESADLGYSSNLQDPHYFVSLANAPLGGDLESVPHLTIANIS